MIKSQARVVRWTLAALLFSLLVVPAFKEPAHAAQTQLAECQIGFSSACPALSPQEIYNIFGNNVDTPVWLTSDSSTSGTPINVFALMNHGSTYNSGWILLAKGTQGSTNFGYSSGLFSGTGYTLNPTSLTNDTTTDAVFSAFDSYPVTNSIIGFSNPTYASNIAMNGGDIANNYWNSWVWLETNTPQTMYTRLTTASTLATSASVRTSLFKSGSNYFFGNETGYIGYGYMMTSCIGVRWGIVFNNESDQSSCDVAVGLGFNTAGGLTGNINTSSYNGIVPAYNVSLSSPSYGTLGSMAFQLWGRNPDPTFGTPQSFSGSSPTAGQANLSWSAPSSGTVSEYVVAYKKSTDPDWTSARTFRVTTPTASPSAVVSGLNQNTTYNFKIWARGSANSSATPLAGNVTTASGVLSGVSLNTATPVYRSTSTISATVSAVGKATFYAQGKVIPGCKNVLTTSTLATCTWTPSFHTLVNISVSYYPIAVPSQISTSSMTALVSPRTAGSKKR